MAQNVTIAGASFSDVPSIVVPKTGGGTASFVDVSPTTAVAEDVASGKVFFLADGTQGVGTSSGGGGGGNLDEIIERTATTISSNATDIKIAIAQKNSALQSISFPEATKITVGYVFQNCSQLTSVSMPKLADISGYAAFQSCTSLEYVALPKYAKAGANNIFDGCNKLKAADFGNGALSPGNVNVFAQSFFNKCTMLTTLILRYPAVGKLGQINNFAQTPFASGGTGGTLYVPSALISSYQSATNWSTILGYANNSIQAIEGSQYENYYADGTPIT